MRTNQKQHNLSEKKQDLLETSLQARDISMTPRFCPAISAQRKRLVYLEERDVKIKYAAKSLA